MEQCATGRAAADSLEDQLHSRGAPPLEPPGVPSPQPIFTPNPALAPSLTPSPPIQTRPHPPAPAHLTLSWL